VGPNLAFVVAGPTGIEGIFFYHGLKGRGFPAVEGVRRLYIVMPVKEEGRGVDRPFVEGIEDGGFAVACRLKAQLMEILLKPVGAFVQSGVVSGLGANSRVAKESFQSFQDVRALLRYPSLWMSMR
jgi:hypothetical protein